MYFLDVTISSINLKSILLRKLMIGAYDCHCYKIGYLCFQCSKINYAL